MWEGSGRFLGCPHSMKRIPSMIMEKSQSSAELLAFRVPVLVMGNFLMLVTHADQFLTIKHTSQFLSFNFFSFILYVTPYLLFFFSWVCVCDG